MANLRERMRQTVLDVAQGDIDGTLRNDLEQYYANNDARIKLIEQNVEQLLSDVHSLKQQGN